MGNTQLQQISNCHTAEIAVTDLLHVSFCCLVHMCDRGDFSLCAFQAQADRLASGSLARSLPPAFRDADVPVSIYSEAALQGQYGGSVYGSRIVGPSIFARNSDFSKPISEYSKIMDADALPMAAERLT